MASLTPPKHRATAALGRAPAQEPDKEPKEQQQEPSAQEPEKTTISIPKTFHMSTYFSNIIQTIRIDLNKICIILNIIQIKFEYNLNINLYYACFSIQTCIFRNVSNAMTV